MFDFRRSRRVWIELRMYRCIDFALSQADTSFARTMDRMQATSDVAHTFFTAAIKAMTPRRTYEIK
jgi:hypothetical protein